MSKKKKLIKCSSGDSKHIHPYLRAGFWMNAANHYWENGNYAERTKERLREMVQKLSMPKFARS